MKKKLLALLLCLVMAVGILPTVVMAEEKDPRNPVVEFTIVKKVDNAENAVTPPAETFEFVLEDTADEKKPFSEYGITLLDDLKIDTDGADLYEKTVRAKIDMAKVNPNGGWNAIIPVGSQTVSSYNKTFHITEKNDAKDGWEYSTAGYAVTFKYDCETNEMTCTLHERGNDVTFRTADFTNTYTKQEQAKKAIEFPFTVTVKQGGNVAPGKQVFELEVFENSNSNADEYRDVTVTASVETNGVKDYSGSLIITGPEDQVNAFTSEGFYVREKDTKAANWTYSDAVWYVMPIGTSDGVDYNLYPAILKTSDNGEYYEFDREHPVEMMTFVNTYTANKTVEPPEKPTNPTESNPNTGALDDVPQTGDNSNMILRIVLLLVSGFGVTGAVVYSKIKKYAK